MIRRAIAHFLMLSFCCFTLEVAVADVHDGDASADEIEQVTGPASANAVGGGGDPSTPPSPEGPPQHLHACHCSHAHGSLTTDSRLSADEVTETTEPRGAVLLVPNAVDLDVQVRPPIA